MIAALLLVTACSIASPSECQTFDNERWNGPTEIELDDCATMADRLNILFESEQYQVIAAKSGTKSARCEIVPMDDGADVEPGLQF